MNQLTPEQAYQILVDAINVATTKGAFTLQDVSTILNALSVLQPTPTEQAPIVPLKDEDKNDN